MTEQEWLSATNEEKIFSINDVVDFLEWAYDSYRIEGVIGSGIYQTTEMVEEYVKLKKIGAR